MTSVEFYVHLELISSSLILENGRECRIRTYDPLLPKQVRYQTALIPDILVETRGFEPLTYGLQSRRSTN